MKNLFYKKFATFFIIQLVCFNFCFSQFDLDDLELEIDNMTITDIPGSTLMNQALTTYKSNFNYMLNDLSAIKRHHSDPFMAPMECPCGEKDVTITATYNDFFRLYLELMEDVSYTYADGKPFGEYDFGNDAQKSDAKEYLARIIEYLTSRGLKIEDVTKIEVTCDISSSGGAMKFVAKGVKITYRICAPCQM